MDHAVEVLERPHACFDDREKLAPLIRIKTLTLLDPKSCKTLCDLLHFTRCGRGGARHSLDAARVVDGGEEHEQLHATPKPARVRCPSTHQELSATGKVDGQAEQRVHNIALVDA